MALDSARALLSILIEALPFLLLGTLTSGLIEAFVQPADLRRWLPRHPVAAALVGSLLGLVFPGGECGVIPVVRRFYQKGAPTALSIAFLLAAPVINPIVIASTYAALHDVAPELIYLRIGVALIIAVSVGILFAFQPDPAWLLRTGTLKTTPEQPATAQMGPGLRRALTVAAHEFVELGTYLALGALLATGFHLVVAQDRLEDLATNPVNSVMVMQVLAYGRAPGSVTDAFMAANFTDSFRLGAVLGFLTIVDLKSTVLYWRVFRLRIVLYLTALAWLMSALITIWLSLNVKF